jgi:hypothetical protein
VASVPVISVPRSAGRRFRIRERERAFREAQDPDAILSDARSKLLVVCGVSLKEQELSDALQTYLTLMAFRVVQGREVRYDETYDAINQIAEDHGFLSGVPIPVITSEEPVDLVMAAGVPLAEIFHMSQELRRARQATEMAEELTLQNLHVRNSWHVLGDQTVCVVDTADGPMAFPRWDAGMRLRKLIRGHDVRFHARQTAAAEFKALDSLKARVNESQFNSYVLSGLLPERSKRSDIWYFFRKGFPTLAVSFHGPNGGQGKVLAALCLHPMGYYQGTHVGLMTPTDEVIAHLLLMRADEHGFWKKSGQWRAEDTRSGI